MSDLDEVLDVVSRLKGSDEAVWLNAWSPPFGLRWLLK